jgi:glycosyltransferase involved in cell wall biosynthesis
MIETIENPEFKSDDFDPSKKKPGISAIVRLKNEAYYLEQALDSIFPFFDELVIVYHQCTDQTPEIVEKFVKKDPKRVKAFHYLPEVFPQGSEQHRLLPAKHVNSLVYYSNFALSRSSYQICVKWDGDMIAAPDPLKRLLERLRGLKPWTLSWWLSPWRHGYWWHCGVNLWVRDGKIYVVKPRPTSGSRRDHGFWPMGQRRIFRHHSRVEVLDTRWLIPTFVGFLFFHVKGMKRDRGISIYQLERNPSSPYKNRIERMWTNPELFSFKEYCRIEPAARVLPDPESIGIRPVRD